jgi:hypothetical protein
MIAFATSAPVGSVTFPDSDVNAWGNAVNKLAANRRLATATRNRRFTTA